MNNEDGMIISDVPDQTESILNDPNDLTISLDPENCYNYGFNSFQSNSNNRTRSDLRKLDVE